MLLLLLCYCFSVSAPGNPVSPQILCCIITLIIVSLRRNGRHVFVYRSRLNVYMPPGELLIFKPQIFLLHTDMWWTRYRYGRKAIYTNSIWVRWIHSPWKHCQLMRFYIRVNQEYLFHCHNNRASGIPLFNSQLNKWLDKCDLVNVRMLSDVTQPWDTAQPIVPFQGEEGLPEQCCFSSMCRHLTGTKYGKCANIVFFSTDNPSEHIPTVHKGFATMHWKG